jgi:hypothetical protein
MKRCQFTIRCHMEKRAKAGTEEQLNHKSSRF